MFDRVSRLERRFKQIAAQLNPYELQSEGEGETLNDASLQDDLYARHRSHRFLSYYSEAGIRRAFLAYGITQALRQRGFDTLYFELLLDDPCRHQVKVYYRPDRQPESLLIDLALHITSSQALMDYPRERRVELLVIDWLMLQDPRLHGSEQRLLPGQRHPGLGLGLEFGALIGQIAQRLKLDGCLTTPAWFHNAVFYQIRYQFVNPAAEGYFRALLRDSADHSVEDVSWAIELGAVYEQSDLLMRPSAPTTTARRLASLAGTPPTNFRDSATLSRKDLSLLPLHWQGRPMIWPMSETLQRYFLRPAWKGHRDAIFDGVHFRVDWPLVMRRLEG